ncbi:MAG: VWA domain-containing protein, partial [Candidatus Aminicenantales bacterium]
MRLKHILCLGLTLCIASFIAIKSFSQTREKPLEYEVKVVVVDVPVYVVDRQGNPVLDLKPEDFVIYEEGKKQKITHFALIRNDSPQIRSLIRKYPSAQRHFLLFFDLSFASLKGILKARDSALKFIQEKLLPTDLVSLATFSIFTGLKIITPFTNDREQLMRAASTLGVVEDSNRVRGPAGFLFKPYQDISISDTKREEGESLKDQITENIEMALRGVEKFNRENYKGYVSSFIQSMKTLAQSLNIIAGRKHLIFFSEGFDSEILVGKSIRDDDRTFDALMKRELWKIDTELAGSPTLRMNLFETLQLFVNSDCTIHTVDIGGLRSESQTDRVSGAPSSLSAIRSGQDTLNLIAHETGGHAFRNINNLDEPLENILKLTNAYYLLGYTPEEEEKEGKFRKIKVEVKRPDVQVSYRKGFYTQKPYEKFSEFEKKLQLVEYIAKDIVSEEIQFHSLPASFRGTPEIAQIPVFIQFPGEQFFTKKRKSKELKLEIYGYALNSRGEFIDFFHQPLGLNLKKLGKRLRTSGIKYFDLLLVPPGDRYKVKLIVRDSETGEIGSHIHEIDLPDYEDKNLAISRPVFVESAKDWILTRGYNPEKPSGRKEGEGLPVAYPFTFENQQFIPGVLPVIRPSVPAQIYFRVYNLKLHPEAKVPQTQMKFEAISSSGKTYPLMRVGLVKKPTQVEPGVYELLLQFVID